MSKAYVVAVMVALLALVAVPAMAGGAPPQSDTADVSVTIEEYAELVFGTTFTMTVRPYSGGSDTKPFDCNANFAFDLTGSMAWDDGRPAGLVLSGEEVNIYDGSAWHNLPATGFSAGDYGGNLKLSAYLGDPNPYQAAPDVYTGVYTLTLSKTQ